MTLRVQPNRLQQLQRGILARSTDSRQVPTRIGGLQTAAQPYSLRPSGVPPTPQWPRNVAHLQATALKRSDSLSVPSAPAAVAPRSLFANSVRPVANASTSFHAPTFVNAAGSSAAVEDSAVGNSSVMERIANAALQSGPNGSCVATVLNNLDRIGVRTFAGGTGAGGWGDTNNVREATVKLINEAGWASPALPGSTPLELNSRGRTATVHIVSGGEYESLVADGLIPSGALVVQTRHDSLNNTQTRGNDLGIARAGGSTTFNFGPMPPTIYAETTQVLVLVPE